MRSVIPRAPGDPTDHARIRFVWRGFLAENRGVGRYALLDLVAAELNLTAGEVRVAIDDCAFARAPYDGPVADTCPPRPEDVTP